MGIKKNGYIMSIIVILVVGFIIYFKYINNDIYNSSNEISDNVMTTNEKNHNDLTPTSNIEQKNKESIYNYYNPFKNTKTKLNFGNIDTVLAVSEEYIVYIGTNDKINIINQKTNEKSAIIDANLVDFRVGTSALYEIKDECIYYSLTNGIDTFPSFYKYNIKTDENIIFDFNVNDIEMLEKNECLSLNNEQIFFDDTGLYIFSLQKTSVSNDDFIKNIIKIGWNKEITKLIEDSSIAHARIIEDKIYIFFPSNYISKYGNYNILSVDKKTHKVEKYFIDNNSTDTTNLIIRKDKIYYGKCKDNHTEIYSLDLNTNVISKKFEIDFRVKKLFLYKDKLCFTNSNYEENTSELYTYDLLNNNLELLTTLEGDNFTFVQNRQVYDSYDKFAHIFNEALLLKENLYDSYYLYFYVLYPNEGEHAKLKVINMENNRIKDIDTINTLSDDVDRILFIKDTLIKNDIIYYYTDKAMCPELLNGTYWEN